MTFSNLLDAGKFVRLIGCHDGVSAKLTEEAGFEGIWSSGFTISCSHCVPDSSILGKYEFMERACEMRRASKLPILVDMDTGYGKAEHIGYHVKDLEQAGINGVCIEDKIFPKSNSFSEGGQELLGIEDFCNKIVSAQTNTTNDFFVVARIEAFISGFGIDDAIYRADAYADSGADAVLIHSKDADGKDIRSFLKAWKKKCPIVLVPTTYGETINEYEMREEGVDIVIYANQLMRVCIYWMKWLLDEMNHSGICRDFDTLISPVKELFRLSGMEKFKELSKKYDAVSK